MRDQGEAQGGLLAGLLLGALGTVLLLVALSALGPLTVEWGEQDVGPATGGEVRTEPTSDAATATVAVPPNPTPPADEEVENFTDAYSEVSDGVVRVATETCRGGVTGSGSLVAPDLVLTAAHVVADYASVQLQLGDQAVVGEVIGMSLDEDLALVKAGRPLRGHVFEMAPETPGIGTPVAALGYPLSGPLSFAGPGVVSAYGENISYQIGSSQIEVLDVMRVSIPINSGNSGGPVIDEQGRVVGIVAAGRLSSGRVAEDRTVVVDVVAGFNFAIPADVAHARVEEWTASPAPVEPRSCETPPTEAQPAELVTASTSGPDVDTVLRTLFDYFDGINRSDYERAYRQLSEERQATEPLESFRAGQESSVISDVVVLETRPEDDNLRAVVTFRSRQAPDLGPDGLSCAYWTLDYVLVPGGEHGWAIHTATEVEGEERYEACT